VQTTRLHESFEGSYSSLSYSRGELSPFAQAASGRLMLFLQFSDFGVQCGFGVITLVPDVLEGQSMPIFQMAPGTMIPPNFLAPQCQNQFLLLLL